ncbi:DUF1304 domain-containing protein [Demequina sp. NBRC 110052]|uniref:DUF1304 domain-containing protein n=1 Tax=Demequina sp. NBRC 110052 TaxID=1570341 RepID=UPI000A073713|nr:DUF1304 domain-containing protein [Demequina sp. NBRC 110052]
MTVFALVAASLAALVHVYIFWLESVAWDTPRARATFGVHSEEQADHTRALAYNQGFYNLFLAVVTIVGVVLIASGMSDAGAALVFAGAGSMLAAAVVLVTKSRAFARPAALQGTLPLVAVLALAASLLL